MAKKTNKKVTVKDKDLPKKKAANVKGGRKAGGTQQDF